MDKDNCAPAVELGPERLELSRVEVASGVVRADAPTDDAVGRMQPRDFGDRCIDKRQREHREYPKAARKTPSRVKHAVVEDPGGLCALRLVGGENVGRGEAQQLGADVRSIHLLDAVLQIDKDWVVANDRMVDGELSYLGHSGIAAVHQLASPVQIWLGVYMAMDIDGAGLAHQISLLLWNGVVALELTEGAKGK